ncbi:uncharacterized protein LOC133038419 [Cannabis sativa]|uniref:uncharacterized protein LOC133038419 n=1 Tax=Cannabis sativa TaxID=3483 RepID=UPI0029CA576C|nr:uncharacterized protein LOC133038419 [Cannabis sativa]
MQSSWPFAIWGIDLIGQLPKGKGEVQYAVVAVDYFTKWTDAEPLATITSKKDTLKKRLKDAKGNLLEELPEVLWSYRTTEKTATGQTPFAMAYGYEAMLPVELEPPSHWRLTYNKDTNHVLLAESLDEIEEK